MNAAWQYLDVKDQTLVANPRVAGKGYSVWATPRAMGWEALLRYDHLQPNTMFDSQLRERTIVGVSYWFPLQGTVSTAILVDYDSATFPNIVPARPRDTRIAVHGLVNF